MAQPRKFVLDLSAGLYEEMVAAAKHAGLPLHLFVRQAIAEKVAAIGAYADPKKDDP